MDRESHPPTHGNAAPAEGRALGTCFVAGREFIGNRFVYLVFSPRAGGLTLGVNLNPDRLCNFDCVYCEVDRHRASRRSPLNLEVMAHELTRMLHQVRSGHLRDLPAFRNLPAELLTLRHVAISGEGEPTLNPRFAEAVQAIVHVRAQGDQPFFKIVLFTNATLLDLPEVQYGLRFLIHEDELWLKLDAGSPEHYARINRSEIPYDHVLANILQVARQRPVVIQSLFPLIDGVEPTETEISDYLAQLSRLKAQGAQIALVQVYSATRPSAVNGCRHLPLKALSRIAHRVRSETGLMVEVY